MGNCKHEDRETRYLGLEAVVSICRTCNARRWEYIKGTKLTTSDKQWARPGERVVLTQTEGK